MPFKLHQVQYANLFHFSGWMIGLLCLILVAPVPGWALQVFDFETPYLVHQDHQIWDFCLIMQADNYHVFYHSIDQYDAHPANADTIWHAVSSNLKNWDILGPALTSGPGWYDEVAMWAPDVVFDDQTKRWAMLYTGISDGMVQRACLAWSDDLQTWSKSPANPVFEPDTLTYFWSPDQNWSSFRDPFLFHDGQQWNMLSTAGLRMGEYPGYKRAIVHRAVSTDLVNWQDAGVFFEHDGGSGRHFDFESVQYLVRDNWHHLFFTEQDPNIPNHPTSHMVASGPDQWTMTERTYVDAGWAPEIKRFDTSADHEIFARLGKGLDPRDNTWFVTVRFDSLRFTDNGHTPEIIQTEGLLPQWIINEGSAGAAAPTFGDNPLLRQEPGRHPEGHGWFDSSEFYGGPLSSIGWPGASLGLDASGVLQSRRFVLEGLSFRLMLAGGLYPETCYIALLDPTTNQTLSTIHPTGENTLVERFWDVSEFQGREVSLAIFDNESRDGGWIAVDGIEERMQGLSGINGTASEAGTLIHQLRATPTPFNGRTEFRMIVLRPGELQVEVFDLRGHRVWASPVMASPKGPVAIAWETKGSSGEALPSGTYFARILMDGRIAGTVRLALVQ